MEVINSFSSIVNTIILCIVIVLFAASIYNQIIELIKKK